MPGIRFDNLKKSFGRVVALDGLSAEVGPGQALALFGPSGCGKTTALRLIAGLERPDAGSIYLNGREVSRPGRILPPGQRGIGMVFQDLALWPHMRALAQIEFVLKSLKGTRAERRARSRALLEQFGLEDCSSNWPHELSGGEKQRLAIARALAADPALILLDEPFANLDEARTDDIIERLKERKAQGVTIVFASHQRKDVAALADTVVMMQEGAYTCVSVDDFREGGTK